MEQNFMKILLTAVLCLIPIPLESLYANERPASLVSELDASIQEDIYVKLYRFRLERRKAIAAQQEQELSLAIKKRERREILYTRNAASAEELEDSRRDTEVAALKLGEFQAQVREAEALLQIAIDRVNLGLEVPICAEFQ